MASTRLATTCKKQISLAKRIVPRKYPQWKIDMGNEIIRVVDSHSKLLVLTYNALNSPEWNDLRYDMRQENVSIKVFRNSIMLKYLESTRYRNLTQLLNCDNALAFSNDMNLKKVLKYITKHPKLDLIGGKIDDVLMNRQQIIEYSQLPTLDESRAQLVHLLSQPSQTLARLLQTNQTNLSQSLANYVDQNSVD